jgi:hypothetical protein
MTIITADQIFDLFGNVSCKRDLQEIIDYIQENKKCYALFDLQLFNNCIATLFNVLNLVGK